MKTLATLTAAALVAMGALGTPGAQARGGGGAVAAGVIGGLAAGALLGAAVAEAHEAPAYGYGYGYARPAPDYGYADDAPVRYRPAPVLRTEVYEEVPVYRRPRVVRAYDDGFQGEGFRDGFGGYGYRRASDGFRRDCDRPHWHGGW